MEKCLPISHTWGLVSGQNTRGHCKGMKPEYLNCWREECTLLALGPLAPLGLLLQGAQFPAFAQVACGHHFTF